MVEILITEITGIRGLFSSRGKEEKASAYTFSKLLRWGGRIVRIEGRHRSSW